ncbi:MAG: XdhC family protein [Cyanobacteria bacterium SZAS LIN-2]|nr:XdhC family protein [Cyanobacteria bacterium SZAS LIN-2]
MDDLVRVLNILDGEADLTAFQAKTDSDPPLALATVVNTRGSAYRRPGARMLVRRSLAVQGAVSAGCLERDIVANCQFLAADDKPVLLTYDGSSSDELIFGLKLGCDGIVQILVEPVALQNSFGQPKFRRLQKLVPEILSDCGRLVAVTIFEMSTAADRDGLDGGVPGSAGLVMLETGSKTYELASVPRPVSAFLRSQAQQALTARNGRSFVVSEEVDGYVFSALIELVQPLTSLMVFGSGQDVDPLVEMADVLGWRVTIVDESGGNGHAARRLSERFRRFNNARVAVIDFEHLPALIRRETINAAVVMTHDYERDRRILRHLFAQPTKGGHGQLPYIGVVGPRRRCDKLLAELALAGMPITEAELARLYSPVGLDLGAERPEEIALSILSEIKAVLAGHGGAPLREKQGPIHEPVHVIKSVTLSEEGTVELTFSAVDRQLLNTACVISE